MTEQRCNSCGKLLFKGKIRDGIVEIKCACGSLNTISVENKKPESRIQMGPLGPVLIEKPAKSA